jgi:hypothetical protein
MKLPFFSNNFVKQLRDNSATNLSKYSSTASWLDSFAAGKPYTHESNQVVDPPPQLVVSDDNPSNDAENAKRIFTWLRGLTPALAMEERLWAYLTHSVFTDYMRARWPAEDANIIRRRYLFEDKTFAALSRNGISRLWWAGYLTRDETRSNPYELTETLFLRQDIHVSLLERSLGKCKGVRWAVLDFLRENSDGLATEKFGKRIQLLLKELNLLGGVAILDALPPEALRRFLLKIAKTLTKDEGVQQ